MDAAMQVVASGALAGAHYALAAVGLALALGLGRVLNLAHGTFVAVGAYLAYETTRAGLSALAAAGPAALAGLVLGLLVERVVVRPVRASPVAAAIVLLALSVVAEAALALAWGAATHSVPLRLPAARVGAIVVGTEEGAGAAISLAALGALALVLRSRRGLALRAAAVEPEIAACAGLDLARARAVTFGTACALAAAAGAFLAPRLSASPTVGASPLAITLAAVLLGGRRGLGGVVLAALALGVAVEAVGYTLPSPWTDVLALAVVTVAAARRAPPLWQRLEVDV